MNETSTPRSLSGNGLVTLAYLKAKIDERSDHLGIFLPLVLDAVENFPENRFTVAEIQEAVAQRHDLAIPQQTVTTLLRRSVAKRVVKREAGRYLRLGKGDGLGPKLVEDKAKIAEGQRRLGGALRDHASRRGLALATDEEALDLLLRFLEQHQVALLLGDATQPSGSKNLSDREHVVVAEFLQDVLAGDQALRAAVRGLLEGFVLYHAAFLPDLAAATRKFKGLQVFFDSVLVRQALGYEGLAPQALLRETVDLLRAEGVKCSVFDKTVSEIRRILDFYESRLGTEEGRKSLEPRPMTRHFLTRRYSPSQVRQMAALLEREIASAGFEIERVPVRAKEFVVSEKALAARLVDETTGDERQPRVLHDVDCVAGVVGLRKGHRSATIEDARVLFATSSPLVIRNVRKWYLEDERETGIEPIVHIRALLNLAWLKRPTLCGDIKLRDLVALCAATLRPSADTWDRFIKHLDELVRSNELTSDEAVAIVVSSMSDRLLRDAEVEDDDPEDIDASTLDEVVGRVQESYATMKEAEVGALKEEYEAKLAALSLERQQAVERAEKLDNERVEERRQRGLRIDGKARSWAHVISEIVHWLGRALLAAGALAIFLAHEGHGGLIGALAVLVVLAFLVMELLGVFHHLRQWCLRLETALVRLFRARLLKAEGLSEDTSRDEDLFTLFSAFRR